MWKKHKHLFLFPAAVPGILAVCWMSGRVSEFNKWYLIIAGTVGLYCWVSELAELLRERKKEYGTSIIFITHDLGVVAELCGRKGNVPLPLFHFVACKKRRFVIW